MDDTNHKGDARPQSDTNHKGDAGSFGAAHGADESGSFGAADSERQDELFLDSMGISRRIKELREQGRLKRMRDDIGCEECEYMGHVVNSDGKAVVCQCTKRKMYRQIYERAAIPPKHWDKTFEDDWNTLQDGEGNDLGAQRRTSEYVKRLLVFYSRNLLRICGGHPPRIRHSGNIKEPLHSVLFEGGNKSGKSFIASVMLQSAIRQGLSAHYVEWSDLIATLRNFDRDDEQDELARLFKSADLIAIDGVEHYASLPSSFIMQLDRLCKARLNAGKPTLLFATSGHAAIEAGSGWKNLVENCITVRLPNMGG